MNDLLACPCCGYHTLPERRAYDVCPICFWEDDGNEDPDGDVGPNSPTTLRAARLNFRKFGAIQRRYVGNVREPLPADVPSESRSEEKP